MCDHVSEIFLKVIYVTTPSMANTVDRYKRPKGYRPHKFKCKYVLAIRMT